MDGSLRCANRRLTRPPRDSAQRRYARRSHAHMEMEAPYYTSLAAAFVRGKLGFAPDAASPSAEDLIQLGLRAGLRLHKFKRTMELRRGRRVFGALTGLAPTSLLGIWSGRGAVLSALVGGRSTPPPSPLPPGAPPSARSTAVR